LWAQSVVIGGVGYTLFFVLDITERKRAETESAQLQKIISAAQLGL